MEAMQGKSRLREVEPKTGKILRYKYIPDAEFAEGLTILNNRVYLVIWKTNKVYSYKLTDFDSVQIKRVRNALGLNSSSSVGGRVYRLHVTHTTCDCDTLQTDLQDGWGMTNNGSHLIMGDSTEYLHFIDPVSFQTTRSIQVTFDGEPVPSLNELEYIGGTIYANIFQTECIAKIDPYTGEVRGFIDAEGLRSKMLQDYPTLQEQTEPDVFNGIGVMKNTGMRNDENRGASAQDMIFVTGKLWPRIYQIQENIVSDALTDAAYDYMVDRFKQKCIVEQLFL